MADFNINCSFNEITTYINRHGSKLSEQDAQTLNTIFQECDTTDDTKNSAGSDGKLNNSEWADFLRKLTIKMPKLFTTMTNFRADKELKAGIEEQLIAPQDNTRVNLPKFETLNNPDMSSSINSKPKIGSNIQGYSDKYDSIIIKYATQYNLEPNLVKAIIKKESQFNPKTYSSSAKCKGLMQVSSIYVKGNLYDPEKNISEGCRILRDSIDTFNGDIEKALMGYNRGIGGAKKAISRGKNPADDTYVKKVLNYYQELNQNIT